MRESDLLANARDLLSRAETDYGAADGLHCLEEGLALLEEALLDGDARQKTVARNLLSTYTTRISASIKARIEANPGLPEPELEQLFKVLVAFDATELDLPDYMRALKIDLVRRLVDRYYEGHSDADKQKILEQLANIEHS